MKKSIPRNLLYIIIGSFLYSISVNSFTVPNQLAEGGVTGLSLLLFYVLKIPPGFTIFILNVFILSIGYKYLDKETIAYTLVAITLITIFLSFKPFYEFIPNNTLLVPIGSGFLMGIGIGVIMLGEGTTAGSDIIAQIMRKYLGMNTSNALLLIDVCVVLPSAIIIGPENAFLTLINLYVQSKVLDFVLEGLNPKKSIFIVSDHYQQIADKIGEQVGRGMTVLYGEGHFTQQQKKILYVIINRQQIMPIKKIVESIDERAFVTISDVQEVAGEGFTYLSPEDQAKMRDKQNRILRRKRKKEKEKEHEQLI